MGAFSQNAPLPNGKSPRLEAFKHEAMAPLIAAKPQNHGGPWHTAHSSLRPTIPNP